MISIKTALKHNFSKLNDTNIDDVIEHFISMPSSFKKMIFEVVKILELMFVLHAEVWIL